MGKIENFIEKYVYNSNMSKTQTYVIGLFDGSAIIKLVQYGFNETTFISPLLSGGLAILAHLVFTKDARIDESQLENSINNL